MAPDMPWYHCRKNSLRVTPLLCFYFKVNPPPYLQLPATVDLIFFPNFFSFFIISHKLNQSLCNFLSLTFFLLAQCFKDLPMLLCVSIILFFNCYVDKTQFIQQLRDILCCFQLLAFMNKVAVNIHMKVFVYTIFYTCKVYNYLQIQLFKNLPYFFPKQNCHQQHMCSNCFAPSLAPDIVIYNVSHPKRCVVVSHCVFQILSL